MLKRNKGMSTARKPLVDISNGEKSSRFSKKKAPGDGGNGSGSGSGALDLLLLVRSDISNLLGEIDELVAQALENKKIDKNANQDIESFRNVLCDMHSSLKPWILKLRQSFGSALATRRNQPSQTTGTNSVSCIKNEENAFPNKNEPELDLIVSPSPLVSWRAGSCTLETGKHLFLLTPLPKAKVLSSKRPVTSKSMVSILHDKNQHGLQPESTVAESAHDDLPEKLEVEVRPGNEVKPCTVGTKNSISESSAGRKDSLSESTFVSPLKCKSGKDSVFLLTPCMKISPPKSSVLHDLNPENFPEPPTKDNDSRSSDGLTPDVLLEGLTSRYQELLGLQPSNNFTKRRIEVNQTLDWFLSPPKTCVLMEPTEEKPVPTPANNGILMLATPLWKDVESTVLKDKRPGENTLKKELWTRFEEVSKDGLHFNASVFQETERKGFLDMLEEACETSDRRGRE